MATENILAMVKKAVESKVQWYAGETITVFQTKTQRVYLTNTQDYIKLFVRKGKRTMKNSLVVASLMPNGWQLINGLESKYNIFTANVKKELSL